MVRQLLRYQNQCQRTWGTIFGWNDQRRLQYVVRQCWSSTTTTRRRIRIRTTQEMATSANVSKRHFSIGAISKRNNSSNQGGNDKNRNHGTLVLLRHGQSIWNKIPTFTGWCDVPLTMQGMAQAQAAGQLLKDRNFTFDVAYTSELKRAIQTCEMSVGVLAGSRPGPGERNISIIKSIALNERHYGALQGRAKNDPALIAEFGNEQLRAFRREFYSTPPPMDENHPYYQPSPAPRTESLADCQRRVVQYWNETILPELQLGSNVLLVAHANTQRALIAYLEDVPPDDVPHIHIPNSVPCIYRIDSETGMSLYPDGKTTSSLNGTTTTTASKGHWLLNEENQHRLAEKLGMTSESFARSVFDAWDVNGDGVLSKEELATGLFTWKNAQDRALSTLAGKLFEEMQRGTWSGPLDLESFQSFALLGSRRHNLPFFAAENP